MISIDRLSDDDLLEIFHFYVDHPWHEFANAKEAIEAWQRLVHVCRRWRSVVFGSPRRLKLRLVCTANTRSRNPVDIWPALPILILDYDLIGPVGSIVTLLERSNLVHRISQIRLWVTEWKDISEAMQVPFPELTDLELKALSYYDEDKTEPVVPLSDSFLGGSAPQLRSLELHRVPYPGLPKLLL